MTAIRGDGFTSDQPLFFQSVAATDDCQTNWRPNVATWALTAPGVPNADAALGDRQLRSRWGKAHGTALDRALITGTRR